MEREKKSCWNCVYYKAYYTKGICCFDKKDCGWCTKRKETVDKHENCDKWREYNGVFRGWREQVAQKRIEEMAENLAVIRQILEEE